jgi:hypothetical protein
MFCLFLFYSEKLVRLGLTEPIYYLVLVMMGLASAVFLFGVLSSSATFEGTVLGGTLKMGGPIVAVALVVYGGHFFIPKGSTFPLTVYVHGEGGPQDTVLKNSGNVKLKLGPEIICQPIRADGQAFFPAVPSDFRGQQVQAWVESDTYASASTNTALDGPSIDLLVKKVIHRYKLSGTVLDSTGNPLSGVYISLAEYKLNCTTRQDGGFELEVEADSPKQVDLVAQKSGYQTVRLSPTLGDTGVNFSLPRSR